jgi:hypothetical protein
LGGSWLGLRIGGKEQGCATLRRAGIALLAIVAAGLTIQYCSVPHRLEYDEAGASLEFELRVLGGLALPGEVGAVEATLDMDFNQHPAVWHDPPMRQEGT